MRLYTLKYTNTAVDPILVKAAVVLAETEHQAWMYFAAVEKSSGNELRARGGEVISVRDIATPGIIYQQALKIGP